MTVIAPPSVAEGDTIQSEVEAPALLGGGEASKRCAYGAGCLDPDEVPGTVDHLDPGARNPLGPVRRGPDRHRAP